VTTLSSLVQHVDGRKKEERYHPKKEMI